MRGKTPNQERVTFDGEEAQVVRCRVGKGKGHTWTLQTRGLHQRDLSSSHDLSIL